MKRIFLTYALLLISIAAFSNSYKAFEKKNVIGHHGIVNMYDVEGKVYMELPLDLMGKRFLMGAMVEACSDPLESSVGYQPHVPYSVCFEKTSTSILLRRINESYADDGGLKDKHSISSVVKSFKIQEYSADSTAFLIDMTSYFVSNDSSVDPIDPKAFNAAEGYVKRTGSHISSTSLLKGIHVGKDNFSVLVSNSYKVKAAFLGVFSSSEQAIFTSEVRRTFALLPEDRMPGLETDLHYGTGSVTLKEYDAEKTSSKEIFYATKWNLKTDSSGTVSNPICFFIDPKFPEQWTPYIHESIKEWNMAFEKAGLHGALKSSAYPENNPEFTPADIRYSCIRYNLSPAERIVDSKWCDPATGEILGTGIIVNHGIAEYIKKNLMLQTGAGNPDSRLMKIDSTLFGKALKSTMLRHIGHCLGLSDNMAGSYAFPVDSLANAAFTQKWGISASVMDELPFNFIGYSSELACNGVIMIQDTPGIYDINAISWMYGGKTANQSELFYGKRQSPSYFYDPRAMSFDLGNNTVESVKKGFDGLEAVVAQINGWIDNDDVDYNFRNGLQEVILLQAYEYIKQVFVNIGGIHINPKQSQDMHNSYVSVPKNVQKEHLLWALERIDDLTFLDNEKLLENSGLRGDTGSFCQKYFTNFIFIQLDAMWYSEIKSDDPYTQEEAMADVSAHIWKGADKGLAPTDLQKYQRNMFINNLLSWSGVRGNYYFREKTVNREASRPDKSHIWYGFLKETKQILEKACKKARSEEARNHYEYLMFQVEQYL